MRVPRAHGEHAAAGLQRHRQVASCTCSRRVQVSELIEACDEKHLLRFQKLLASYELLIVDELGFVPRSKTGAELLFETLASAPKAPRLWSPAIYPSNSGPRSSAPNASPVHCLIASPTMSTSRR